MAVLEGRKIAFVVANEGVEEQELIQPWEQFKAAGANVELVAPEFGQVQAFEHLEKSNQYPVDRQISDIDVEDYDAVVLPGGVANPDQLRTDENALQLIRDFWQHGKPVAAICHAPWVLVEAGLVEGKVITSWPSLHTDVENAGGTWVDEEVQVDGNLITSRKPDDLAAFADTIIESIRALPSHDHRVEGDNQIEQNPQLAPADL